MSDDALRSGLYERTHILVGDAGIRALRRTNVLLVGVGGVGGSCAEALVRAGIGRLTLLDHDVVCASNKNRQLVALDSTVGRSKVEVLAARLREINPDCVVTPCQEFLRPEDAEAVVRREAYDFIVDCIDSVGCKIALLAAAAGVRPGRVFSACGAGGRVDPGAVGLGDLLRTTGDGLARRCRRELRSKGLRPGTITAVSSRERGLPHGRPNPPRQGPPVGRLTGRSATSLPFSGCCSRRG